MYNSQQKLLSEALQNTIYGLEYLLLQSYFFFIHVLGNSPHIPDAKSLVQCLVTCLSALDFHHSRFTDVFHFSISGILIVGTIYVMMHTGMLACWSM